MADGDYQEFEELADIQEYASTLPDDGERIRYFEWLLPRLSIRIDDREIRIQAIVAGGSQPGLMLRRHTALKSTRLNIGEALAKLKEQAKGQSGPAVEKIKWHGDLRPLAYLFEVLHKRGFIDADTIKKKFKTIEQHFVDKDGNPIDSRKLSNNVNKSERGKPKGWREIESFVDEIEKD